MQTTQHLAALKAMGIEVWRDRFAVQAQPLEYHCLVLGESKTIILADIEPAMATEEQNLVEAIAKALGADGACGAESWSQIEDTLDHYETIIAMGDQITNALHKKSCAAKIMSTHSPSQLLMAPKLKSETWQLIRHLKV